MSTAASNISKAIVQAAIPYAIDIEIHAMKPRYEVARTGASPVTHLCALQDRKPDANSR